MFFCIRSKPRCSQQLFTDGSSGEQCAKPKQPQKPYNHPEMSEVLKIKVGCFLGKHMHLGYLKQMSLFIKIPLWNENIEFITVACKTKNMGKKKILGIL